MLRPHIWDERREITIPGDYDATLHFCVEHFIQTCKEAIKKNGIFCVALSGGSTPKAIYQAITSQPYAGQVDWSKVHLFWSDERSVSPESPESNYHMAMQAGFSSVPIPSSQIHRMVAEDNIEVNAKAYEILIKSTLKGRGFDLMMLGMGEDGHTASLFPATDGLHAKGCLVIPNFVPQKSTWRMSVTFECINASQHIAIYVLGSSKREQVCNVLCSTDSLNAFPIQKVGTPQHKALWILDLAAAENLQDKLRNKHDTTSH